MMILLDKRLCRLSLVHLSALLSRIEARFEARGELWIVRDLSRALNSVVLRVLMLTLKAYSTLITCARIESILKSSAYVGGFAQ